MSGRPTPADYLTLARLLSIPVLWALAVLRLPAALAVGLAVSGLTDVLDGPVARYSGRTSRRGSQLDSVADILLMISMPIWMIWLEPEFIMENLVPLGLWVALGIASLAATLVRFGRLGNLHLYSAKAAGFVGYVFAVTLLLFDGYSRAFFVVAVTLAIAGASETLLAALMRDRADERIGSIVPGLLRSLRSST